MARPKLPTALHEVKGSYKKDPQRRPENEPLPTGGIGPYPERLILEKSLIWDEIVSQCAPGVLANMDRIWLEIVVDLLHKQRMGDIKVNERSQLITLLSRIGFNPADRSKIVIPKGEKKNKFSEVM